MVYHIFLNNFPIMDNVINCTRILIFYRNQYENTLQNTVWRKPNALMHVGSTAIVHENDDDDK